MRSVSLFAYWSLQLPHLLMGVFIVLLLLRLALAAVVSHDRGVARLFGAITWPVTAPIGFLTPRIVPPAGVIACAIAWLITARIVLSMVALGLGVRLWG
jgi:hypothetical protein